MKYNVLVIAGTTESRQVIEKLLGENPNERILASVATELPLLLQFIFQSVSLLSRLLL